LIIISSYFGSRTSDGTPPGLNKNQPRRNESRPRNPERRNAGQNGSQFKGNERRNVDQDGLPATENGCLSRKDGGHRFGGTFRRNRVRGGA
jgi:hypothetical protein